MTDDLAFITVPGNSEGTPAQCCLVSGTQAILSDSSKVEALSAAAHHQRLRHKCPSTFLAVQMLEVSFSGAALRLRAPSCFPLLQARLCQQPWTLKLAAASVSGAMCVLGADSSLARGWLGAAGHPGGARAVEMSSERSLSLPGRYHRGVLVLFSHGNRCCSLDLLHARPSPGHVTVTLTSVSQGVCCPQLTTDYTEHQFNAWSVSGMGCLGMLKSNPK